MPPPEERDLLPVQVSASFPSTVILQGGAPIGWWGGLGSLIDRTTKTVAGGGGVAQSPMGCGNLKERDRDVNRRPLQSPPLPGHDWFLKYCGKD